ncbi:hypothetical protein MLD38_006187 [Melastoma candidum]|uniref:Uncharacterized protein n=1 Tax=Melastoma candidum TaxID=119954 RepID=A0ACB9RLR2_9MYRT|nr:hypothetical protein MLD38_006187 [Melastoma candidum]
MSLGTAEDDSASEIRLHPAEIDWHMLDKSRFFFLGTALFSGVSAALYPAIVLKTRQQVSTAQTSYFKTTFSIVQTEGLRGFYGGFGTSLVGTIPARAVYMAALEVTKSGVGSAMSRLGFTDASAALVAGGAAGLTSAMAAQLVWTPVDVISQRLMVRHEYRSGIDAFHKIIRRDGPRGLYRGFGISILTYAPSNAVWWASYAVASRVIWDGYSFLLRNSNFSCHNDDFRPSGATTVAVQGLGAATASGVSAVITMPLDTIKTRLQVLDAEENGRRTASTFMQTAKSLVEEGGLRACYRGLGPRWASMAMSAATMVTTYEFLKKLSAKDHECLG